jgi:hypothetical protein
LFSGNFQRFDISNLGDAREFFIAAGNEINVFRNIGCGISDIQIKLGGILIK